MTRSELHGDTKILFLCIYGWMDWKRNKMHVELTKRKYVSTVVHNVYLLLSISGCVGCVRVRMNIFVLVAYVYLCMGKVWPAHIKVISNLFHLSFSRFILFTHYHDWFYAFGSFTFSLFFRVEQMVFFCNCSISKILGLFYISRNR